MIAAQVSENPGGEAPGSGRHTLRALLANAPDTCFGFVWDPATAAQALDPLPQDTIETFAVG